MIMNIHREQRFTLSGGGIGDFASANTPQEGLRLAREWMAAFPEISRVRLTDNNSLRSVSFEETPHGECVRGDTELVPEFSRLIATGLVV